MATVVKYNGVTMYNVVTRQWDQEVLYDASGTDLLGQKLKLSFDGILHAQRTPLDGSTVYISHESTSPNVFDLLSRVRARLTQPRQQLQVLIDGNLVVDIQGPSQGESANAGQAANADISNGPKPRNVSVHPIGATAFRVSFTIEAEFSSCGKTRDTAGLVLSNRWHVSEAMDANFFVTRTIGGRLRLSRAPQIPGDTIAGHFYKPLVIPPLESSFRRDRVDFNAEEDGLSCTYQVVDKQTHTAAPWPATKISATHSETVNNGTFFYSSIDVRLEGDPACDKKLLVERAIQVADARMNFLSIAGKATMIEELTVVDHIGEIPAVDLRMRIKRVDQASSRSLLLGMRMNKIGTELELPSLGNDAGRIGTSIDRYDSQRSPVPQPYGYRLDSTLPDKERRPAVVYLLQCYLQNPCNGPHSVGPRGDVYDNRRGGGGEESYQAPEVYESPSRLPVDPDTYSEATKQNIYTVAKVSSTYESSGMRIALPRASRYRSNGSEVNPNPSAIIANLAEVQTRRVFRVDLERVGAMPETYGADPYGVGISSGGPGGKAVPAEERIEILAPIRSPDGRDIIYRVIQTVVELMTDIPVDSMPVGINPSTNFEGYDGRLNWDYSDTLAGTAAAPKPPKNS